MPRIVHVLTVPESLLFLRGQVRWMQERGYALEVITSPGDGIEEFEKTVDAPAGASEREAFHNNIISNIGAYALDNPNQPVEYSKVFPEFIRKLENHYFEQQKSQMRKIGDAIPLFGTEHEDRASDGNKLARETIRNMIEKYGYSEHCAPQTIQFLIKSTY